MEAFLGIDFGLSGARAAVVAANGTLLAASRRAIRQNVAASGETDPGIWLEAGAQAAREALAAAGAPRIEAVGVGAFGPCAVTLDEALRPTGPASLFAFDTRHEPWRRRLIKEGASGEEIGADHTFPKMMRLREVEPERFARTNWVVDTTGYAVAQLTGVPVMDPITALDHAVKGREPPSPLPPVMSADAIAGRVTAEAGERFGVRAGTPVAVGSYDSYVDLFGAGVRNPGDAGLLLGSTLIISAVTRIERAPPALRLTPHIGPALAIGGWTSAAGSAIAWADRVLAEDRHGEEDGRLPGGHGLLMLPYLAGERAPIWDPDARGALLGLTLSTEAGDIRQACLEAVALSAADIAGRLDEVVGPVARYRVAGGGAVIPGLVQAVASATGAALEVVEHPREALGGALLAAQAVGRDVPRGIARMIRPEPRAQARYAELLALYRPLYRELAAVMHRLGRMAV